MFMFRRLLLVAGLASLLLAGAGAAAEGQPRNPDQPASPAAESAKEPDAAMKAALDELDLKYEIGPNGDFKLIFDVGEGRSQLVFIQSEMESYGGSKIREIWSPVMKVKGPLAADLANQLLVDSQDRKVGGWQVMDLGEDRLVVYAIKLPDPKEKEELFRMINAVMLSADEMEKKLTEKDDY